MNQEVQATLLHHAKAWYDRILLAAPLFILILGQALLMSKVLTDAELEPLNNIVYGMNVYELLGYSVTLWLVVPLLRVSWFVIVRYYRHGIEGFRENPRSETV